MATSIDPKKVKTERQLMVYNVLALLCGVWFMLLGWVWTYYINLFFVFPFAIAGFFLWRLGRPHNSFLNKIAGATLLAGFICSIASLILMLR